MLSKISSLMWFLRLAVPLSAAPTVTECLTGWAGLTFSPFDYERYPVFFANDSFVNLAPAGTYYGPESMAEYMRFGSPLPSAYKNGGERLNVSFGFSGVKDSLCSFYAHSKSGYNMTSMAKNSSIESATMLKFEYDPSKNKVMEMYAYFTPQWLQTIWSLLDTVETAAYICETMQNKCADTWSFNSFTSQQMCIDAYQALPLWENEAHFDGMSKSCRMLHGDFAAENPNHCPHISIAPQEDSSGMTKCSISENAPLDTHFDASELLAFETFMQENDIVEGVNVWSAPSPMECAVSFAALQFDPFDYDRYPAFFTSTSFVNLAPAGTYYGPDSMAEYMRFGGPNHSDYTIDGARLNVTSGFRGAASGSCSFYTHSHARYTMAPMGGSGVLESASAFKLEFNPYTSRVTEMYVYFTPEYLKTTWTLLDTEATAEHICSTMATTCGDTWSFNNFTEQQQCLDAWNSLPLWEHEVHFDGDSKACRMLHASFARRNNQHCPHISFAPQLDASGLVKCRVSENTSLERYFDSVELDDFERFRQDNGIADGFKVGEPVLVKGWSSCLHSIVVLMSAACVAGFF